VAGWLRGVLGRWRYRRRWARLAAEALAAADGATARLDRERRRAA
jgi:hypothetical protein